ncbi:MAG TPA: N-acetyl-alpha-D-glucosaminyl L-malate synthase BshA [Oligoflexia bacterium]|nr:N-acetyl-alpha-D-glucosaminyl L-malate synthase BshA [Oligoflexia bacterium]HMP48972.1 N-acetyl-alpha-D-glucosaminyl L-malate synthase BshA [Oligoflexia bacterium]
MNIGITCYPTFGGSGVVATEIGLSLAKLGHQIHFICYDIPRRLPGFVENIFFHEVEVREYSLFEHQPYALSLASKMVEVSTYEKLDLIHVHYAIPHATSAYLAKQILGDRAPKIITTLHGTDITLVGQDRSYLPITRFSIMESDGVTTPSQFLRSATYDKLNVPSSTPIKVIPNFVDLDRYSPASEECINPAAHLLGVCPRKSNTRILLHVSNFRPVKRIGDVLRVFSRVHESIPSHLVLIGDGPDRSSSEALARELGIEKNVCFLGKQESFIPWLQHADLFLLPSELESFGLAALEAMSCGVPVIASNAQGIPEVVKHGETGFIAEVGNWEKMADYALSILNNKELHQNLRNNARIHAVKNYNSKNIISMYLEFYQNVLSK